MVDIFFKFHFGCSVSAHHFLTSQPQIKPPKRFYRRLPPISKLHFAPPPPTPADRCYLMLLGHGSKMSTRNLHDFWIPKLTAWPWHTVGPNTFPTVLTRPLEAAHAHLQRFLEGLELWPVMFCKHVCWHFGKNASTGWQLRFSCILPILMDKPMINLINISIKKGRDMKINTKDLREITTPGGIWI